ncbi:MAG: hypothetical protein AAF436_03670 [Myxococcota bacterium]
MSKSLETLREEHGLVARAFHTAQAANARTILLVSARSGDGKTHLAGCIQRQASAVTNEPSEVLSFKAMRSALEPGAWQASPPVRKGYRWVDGVSLLDGAGTLALTPALRSAFDGALLVARGMETTRADAAYCAKQLGILGIPVLGGVWNSFDCPPPAEAARMFVAGLAKWPPRLPPGVLFRQLFRRSP